MLRRPTPRCGAVLGAGDLDVHRDAAAVARAIHRAVIAHGVCFVRRRRGAGGSSRKGDDDDEGAADKNKKFATREIKGMEEMYW